MPGPSQSDFASTVHSTASSWPLAPAYAPPAIFHAKFWGKPMEGERVAWQNSLPEDPMEVKEDRGLGDVHPDSYVLNIGIQGIDPEQLWIRADYIRIFDHCVEVHKKTLVRNIHARSRSYIPSFAITGQRGIGKAAWILYAARRCAGEKRQILWLFQKQFYLFVDEGVYKLPPDWVHEDFKSTTWIWTFIDEDVIAKVCSQDPKLVVFFITAPEHRRWDRMGGGITSNRYLIMNPCSREDIKRLACIHGIPEGQALEKYDHLGPDLHICLSHNPEELQIYEYRLEYVLKTSTMSTSEFQKQANNLLAFSTIEKYDAELFCLFSLHRREIDDFIFPRLAPISTYIQTRLANRFHKEPLGEKIRLYYEFKSSLQGELKMAGVFYETAVLSCFEKKISLALRRVVTRKFLSDSKHDRSTTEVVASEETFPVIIDPVSTVEYSEDGLGTLLPDVFYVPKSWNRNAVESFIYHNGKLYVFQFTLGGKYGIIQRGILKLASDSHLPPEKDWRFVFVIPPDAMLTVVPQEDLKEFDLYSSIFDI